MNNAQVFKAIMMFDVYKALHELIESTEVDVASLSNKDLVHEIMVKTRGHYNPAMITEIIDNL